MSTTRKTITLDELKKKLEGPNKPLFWNVLTDDYFKGETIPGAERVPLDTIGRAVRERAIPKDAEIITFCSGPACPQSGLAADKLTALGYTNAFAFEGGIEVWKKAGLPVAA